MLGWLRNRKRKPEAVLKDALGAYELPTFPANVTQALAQLRSPASTLQEIGDTLLRDPGLSVRLVKLANSPAYGLRNPVKNVHHAVSLLGRSNVETLLLSVAVRKTIPKNTKPLSAREFWKTSAVRASIAQKLAARVHPAGKSEAFTAGLLQDMAIPLLLHARRADYQELVPLWVANGDLVGAERDRFGWDHGVVAGMLCKQWDFPETLTSTIGSHHEPEAVQELGLRPTSLVVSCLSLGVEGAEQEAFVEEVHRQLGVPHDETKRILTEALAEGTALARELAA
ncbi:MAG: HDOD domain-containing protein [Myxococcota bacterium]